MSDYIVEVKLTYRVTNVTSPYTAERSVRSELFNDGEMWHDEDKVDVERLAIRTTSQLEAVDSDFNEMR